jgi:large subunit ribosomal protein L5
MSNLKSHYNNIVKYDILTKFHEETSPRVCDFKKIVLHLGKKEVNLKLLLPLVAALELLSYQSSFTTLVGSSSASLKIQKGAPVGCKVTLRAKYLYSFFFNVVSQIFPDVTAELSNFKIKKSKTFEFKLNDIINFSEIEKQYELFRIVSKLDISVVTNAKSANHLNMLFSSFRFPIR